MIRKASLAGVLALALAPACGGSRERGPAWPKPHADEADGGESLAPRQSSAVAAIEQAPDAPPSVAAPAADPVSAPAARPEPPAPDAPDAPADTDPEILETEEIIIEIED